MKRIFFTLLLVCAVVSASQGQDFKWGAQNKLLPFSNIIEKDGFIYGTGYNNVLTKTDAKGKVLWTKLASPNINGIFIRQDHKGNLYVAGSFTGNPPVIDTRGGQVQLSTITYVGEIFLAKMDTAGNILWIKQSQSTDAVFLNAIEIDKDDNVYLGGTFAEKTTFGNTSLDCRGMADVYIVKYGPDGQSAWAKQIGGSQADAITGILSSPTGKLYATGSYDKDAIFDTKVAPTTGGTTGYIVSFDPATGLADQLTTHASMLYNTIVYNQQKNALYANVLFTGTLTAGGHTLNSQGNEASAILIMDPDFKPTEVYQIYVVPAIMAVNNDGVITIGGSFETSITMKPGLDYKSYGESDIYMLSYDNKGNFLWSVHGGGENIDDITAMAYTEDQQSLLIAGTAQNGPAKFGSVTLPGDFSGNGFILKMGASMSDVAPLPIDPEGKKLVMHPNPIRNHEMLMIDLGDAYLSSPGWSADIYAMDGRCVASQQMSSGQNKIQVGVDKPGVYLVKMHNQTEMRTSQLVVQ